MHDQGTEHLMEEQLEAYAMHSLGSEDEVAAVEEHLLLCVTCQENLQTVEVYVRAMQTAAARIRKEEKPAPASPGAWATIRQWLAGPIPLGAGAFATIALILTLGLHYTERPGAPVDVDLQATRGATEVAAPTGHPLHLHLDARGLTGAAWHVQVVDDGGQTVWSGSATASQTTILANIDQPLSSGVYFVRLATGTDNLVREYQLAVRP